MDADHVTSRPIMWKFPAHPPTTAIIGDSQVKYVHQHFAPQINIHLLSSPNREQPSSAPHIFWIFCPAVSPDSSCIWGPTTSPPLVSRPPLQERRPDILHVYATLVLPRSPNRRRGSSNRGFVARFNGRAHAFNGRLRGLCHRERNTYFLDHCLDQLPRCLAMAADGLHLSFCGVSYLAWNVHRLWRPVVDTCMLTTADPYRVTASSDDLPSTGSRPLVLTHERDSDLAGDRPTAATLTPADLHWGATSSDDFPSRINGTPTSPATARQLRRFHGRLMCPSIADTTQALPQQGTSLRRLASEHTTTSGRHSAPPSAQLRFDGHRTANRELLLFR
ncbi:hypothetical protein HPB47_020472, partial [Ixodes persulcatus]